LAGILERAIGEGAKDQRGRAQQQCRGRRRKRKNIGKVLEKKMNSARKIQKR